MPYSFPYIVCVDTASIISDLASPHLSMIDIAARHGLTLNALAAFITSDQAAPALDQLQSAAAIRTRLIAQLHLPIAATALSAILQSHRAASFPAAPTQDAMLPANAPQHTDPLDIAAREEYSPGEHARPAAPPSSHEPDQSHSSLDAAPPPPTSPHASAPHATSPTFDHARTLRHQVELRRAAATLLRFATFNHRAIARAHSSEPRHAIVPHEPSRESELLHATIEPQQVYSAADPSRDSASSNLSVEAGPAPVPSSSPIASPSPASASNLASSPSTQSRSTTSIPFPLHVLPSTIHRAFFNPISSSTPPFIRAPDQ
ncbi:MAG: hypothetical protein KF859_12555 [Phycisphaeraceae bacterium]|nr:hypothetical protein [Phycisphaeraceae bacterium]